MLYPSPLTGDVITYNTDSPALTSVGIGLNPSHDITCGRCRGTHHLNLNFDSCLELENNIQDIMDCKYFCKVRFDH